MTKDNLYKKQCIIFNSLFEKNNIQEIVDTAETIFKNPIFILNTSYQIIAKSSLAREINSYTETDNGDCYLMNNLIDLMNKNKCIDSIYSINKSFFFEDKNTNDKFIFSPIKTNSLTTFYIGIPKTNTEFIDEHLDLADTLAKVLSIQIEKDDIFISNSGSDYEYYLNDLISNKIDNIDYLKKRFNNINFPLYKYFIIMSIPFKKTSADYKHNFALKELFLNIKNIFNNSIFTYYEEKLVFLITSDLNSVITNNEYVRFKKFLRLNKLKCGISTPFLNILDTTYFFNQAVFASSLALKNNIIFFNDYIDTYLLANCSSEINLLTLIHPCINELKEYDNTHNTELLKTLKIYLSNNRNVIKASTILNIHKSTFFYRFHKIENIINCSLDTDNMLFKLELSFKILEYIKNIQNNN
ncbi:helix-turn-helix domain-containing protein [Clostridium sp. DSM 8431]|uniref:PucR family transcriptional regulator n=1 Tax=Clostridium sp. DSM 8431 TaxID=1761781 RepID=UPI001587304C|nr:helix-turn-helix domain-containing protein [Clostridium sp. DSM 8431]